MGGPSERVSGIRQQDMAWARQASRCTIRPEPGLKANITEPSCHGQERERGAGQAPAVIIVKVVCSLRLRSHTQPDREPERSQSQSRSRSRGITTGAPHPHTVTYKPRIGEELWVHSTM